MDDRKELSGFAGNELLFASIKRWPVDQQTMFLKLIRLLNSAGIDMWYSKKKTYIRCGLRFVGRSHGRGYLRFGGIACNLDGFLFSMQLSDTGLPQKKRIAVDDEVLKKIESAFALWSIRLAENSVPRPPNTLGSWPIDYSEEDPSGNDSDLEDPDLITQSEFRSIPLNQILFGPPGTGKTYSTIDAALEILDPDILANNRNNIDKRKLFKARFDEFILNQDIRFVTFHQSLSYEDFVEGLAATTDDGKISYEVKPGIFKQLCDAALAKVIKRQDTNINLAGKRIWKMSLGNTQGDDAYIFQECIEQNRILLGYGDELDFSHCKDRAAVHEHFVASGRTELSRNSYEVTAVSTLVSRMSIGDLVVVSEGNYKFRAIGEITSDYQFIDRNSQDGYNQSRSVRWLRVYQPGLPNEQLMNNAFSQMTLYELRDTSINHDKLRALFSDPQERDDKPRAKVLIIDEINRGNIAKIFGELITLIEPSKRKVVEPKDRSGEEETLEVVLPYSKTTFSVPNNVYIIGTMNTSDRSLAGLDIALRRRFTFKEMPPKPELLDKVMIEGINIGDLLRVMNQRIEVLLGRDYCLGHAYFMSLNNQSSITDLAAIFQKQIFPLLQEYFFEDWQRIQWVLNDHNKKSLKFIERKDQSLVQELFGSELPIAESQLPWTINEEAFISVDAYKGIIKAVNP
ncbi:MAG: AAA family ATPase [Cellvibrio sp.]|uniref:AAA family ATPase n=1 Tax=Cellvibrio sp. TaxID=1965322 RepID=UPI00271841D5|nr:AAA family ATPase [Cellvibrio sp.]